MGFLFCLSFWCGLSHLPFAVDNDLNLRHEIQGQPNMSLEFAHFADRLHIDLLTLDFVAGLLLNAGCYVLSGDGAIELARFTCLGGEG